MKSLSIYIILFLIPFCLLAQEKISKKELRQQKRKEKLEKQHLQLIEAVKDTVWTFGSFKSNKTTSDRDYGVFTLDKKEITLEEVFIPNAKSTNEVNRIPTYIAPLKSYSYVFDNSAGLIQISLVFVHERTNYSMSIEKSKEKKYAVVKIKSFGKVLVINEGRLR